MEKNGVRNEKKKEKKIVLVIKIQIMVWNLLIEKLLECIIQKIN